MFSKVGELKFLKFKILLNEIILRGGNEIQEKHYWTALLL